jgi:hypothetical protein
MPNFTNLRSPARARTASSRSSDGLKSSARHHIANRGRMPLPATRRADPRRVQGFGYLPQCRYLAALNLRMIGIKLAARWVGASTSSATAFWRTWSIFTTGA